MNSYEQEARQEGEVMDIHKACRIGDLEAISQACKAEPNKINSKDSSVIDKQLGWAPLYRTVICGHYEATEFLLLHGAEPNIQNNLGETPLHHAADNSEFTMAQLLLSFKSDPNIQQNDGDSSLHHAAFRGDAQMTGLLLSHGADPNLPNFMVTYR